MQQCNIAAKFQKINVTAMYCVMSGWENTIVNIIDTVLLENHFFYYEDCESNYY